MEDNSWIELKCHHPNSKKKSLKQLKAALKELNTIDYITYNADTNTLQIIRNPYGFVYDNDTEKIKYDFDNKMTNEELRDKAIKLLNENGYKIIKTSTDKIIHYKKFPDTQKEFNKDFISETNEFKNIRYFQKKIVGMVSYLGDKKLMPDFDIPKYNKNSDKLYKDEDIYIEEVIMNKHVLAQYAKVLEI